MKKLFTSKQDSQYDSFIGKQYLVGDLSLVVEDVIAEGNLLILITSKDVPFKARGGGKHQIFNFDLI